MEPLITLRLEKLKGEPHAPGDVFRFASQVDAVAPEDVTAIEASVLWRTEGKGDEDIGVHFFERATATELGDTELCARREYETVLPRSPLSYDGFIVKVIWVARVRVFLRNGKESVYDVAFQLGPISTPKDEAAAEDAEQSV